MISMNNNRVFCYISGVRVDPIAVTVSAARGDYATFTVTVPGIPEWDILQPRSVCAVFYADDVSATWRLLVEGEFIADNKIKTAAGIRQVALSFRSLHGCFASATNISISGAGTRPEAAGGLASKQLQMVANARRIMPSGTESIDLPSIAALMGTLLTTAQTASVFFPQLVRYVLSQLPVEAYYMYERRLEHKMFALLDEEIMTVVDVKRMKMLIDGVTRTRLDDNMSVSFLLSKYESMMMYQHIPVLAPPIYGKGASQLETLAPRDGSPPQDSDLYIPEMLFTPTLYAVIPPACNVIFQDQIQMLSRSRDYASEPTRIITTLSTVAGEDSAKVYMSNTMTDSFDAATALQATYPGGANGLGAAASHTMLSGDELNRGVTSASVSISLEQLPTEDQSTAAISISDGPATTWEHFFDQNTRHHFNEVVGQYRNAELTCVFLPMLVAGVPCLVEDQTGPFHGYIESVTHILPNDSSPQTVVRISHMRPALIRDGIDVTPPLPSWMNASFCPSGINGTQFGGTTTSEVTGTWGKLFGKNANDRYGGVAHAAMVPEAKIEVGTTSSVTVPAINPSDPHSDPPAFSTQQVNMDKLAGEVVPVYQFTKDYKFIGITTNTIADKLRQQSDPNRAMQAYNWRPGVSVSQYILFHALQKQAPGSDVDSINYGRPPDTLFDTSALSKGGLPFFAAPFRMTFTGALPIEKEQLKLSARDYGGYRLEYVSGILYNPARQQAMLTIKAALDQRITKS